MREKILAILKKALGETSIELVPQAKDEFGHYATPVALRLGKEQGVKPLDLAKELVGKIEAAAPAGFFSRIEVAGPGFINIWLSDEVIREEFSRVAASEAFGDVETEKGKRIMIEFTDPNPFKQFHIGHLMTNTIGESLARIKEAAGAEVLRVTWQGDVGMHIAMAVLAIQKGVLGELPDESVPLSAKMEFLGKAYAAGSKAYREDAAAKSEIESLNKRIYDRTDPEVNAIYDMGRQWSLDYFEIMYARLGSKFVRYFFESEEGPRGLEIVAQHPDVFEKSEGAIIFRGEQYGLHTRVFVNAQGLPTYEAKELGLNKRKFELYNPDFSLIVTANEINEYFRVLMKAMELTMPEVASKTMHVGHGMLRLPTGKMSSRTGEVITAEWLLEEIKKAVEEKMKDRETFTPAERERVKEQVAIAAIRYSILRQGLGKDIIFDLETSIAFHGDSGPYLQYTYARLRRVLLKHVGTSDRTEADLAELTTEHELRLMRKMFEFPEEVRKSASELTTNNLATYLYEFANLANRFYEDEPILTDENLRRKAARLLLADTAATILRRGLHLLGIGVEESI